MSDAEKKIRIHNMGIKKGEKFVARKIIFPAGWDDKDQPLRTEDGKKTINDVILPNQHKPVTYRQYRFLKDQFRDEIINIDDISELQRQFEEKKPVDDAKKETKAPEGYVSKDEMQAAIDTAVARVLARVQADKSDAKASGAKVADDASDAPETSLIMQLDGMDKSELIAFVEKEGLDVDARKYKKMDDFRAAVLIAMENHKAADSTIEANNSGIKLGDQA